MVVIDPSVAAELKRLLSDFYFRVDGSDPFLCNRIINSRNLLDMALFRAIPVEELGG